MQPPLDVKNIAALQEFVNSLQFHGDGINIDIDHNQAGIVFRFIGENNVVQGQAAAGGNFNLYIVKSVTETTITGVLLSEPNGTPVKISPLSYQNVNIRVGATITGAEYTTVTL